MKIRLWFPVIIRGWEIQFHPWQTLRRWLLSRCHFCGKGFKWNETVVGRGWDSPKPRWFEAFRGEREICHQECAHHNYANIAKSKPVD